MGMEHGIVAGPAGNVGAAAAVVSDVPGRMVNQQRMMDRAVAGLQLILHDVVLLALGLDVWDRWQILSEFCMTRKAPVSYTHLTLPTNREV